MWNKHREAPLNNYPLPNYLFPRSLFCLCPANARNEALHGNTDHARPSRHDGHGRTEPNQSGPRSSGRYTTAALPARGRISRSIGNQPPQAQPARRCRDPTRKEARRANVRHPPFQLGSVPLCYWYAIYILLVADIFTWLYSADVPIRCNVGQVCATTTRSWAWGCCNIQTNDESGGCYFPNTCVPYTMLKSCDAEWSCQGNRYLMRW